MIWWWQFWCNEGCTPDSITKLGWELKIRSIQEEDESKMCVGSLIIWVNPNYDVIYLTLLPSKLVWSFAHQFVNIELKSPIATKREGLFRARLPKVLSKFSQKVLKTSWADLVICWEQQNYMSCPHSSIQTLYIHLQILYWEPLTVDIFYNRYRRLLVLY